MAYTVKQIEVDDGLFYINLSPKGFGVYHFKNYGEFIITFFEANKDGLFTEDEDGYLHQVSPQVLQQADYLPAEIKDTAMQLLESFWSSEVVQSGNAAD